MLGLCCNILLFSPLLNYRYFSVVVFLNLSRAHVPDFLQFSWRIWLFRFVFFQLVSYSNPSNTPLLSGCLPCEHCPFMLYIFIYCFLPSQFYGWSKTLIDCPVSSVGLGTNLGNSSSRLCVQRLQFIYYATPITYACHWPHITRHLAYCITYLV